MEKLGQNFLTNKEIVKKIIDAANLNADDFVLEIGPGKGILTEELAKKAGRVVAVEIDKALSNLLLNKLSNRKNVEIVNRDILKTNLKSHKLKAKSYKIVANLPYYITSPIIRMFLEAENPPTEMILMVQKEVAERITAGLGDMSILSVAVQYYAKPEILFYVGKENFKPTPEVDSAIIKIVPYSSSPYLGRGIKGEGENTKKFFRVVKSGFCAKRKTLANNLANSFHLDKKIVEEKLKAVPLSGTTRAQELSVDDWKKLVKLF